MRAQVAELEALRALNARTLARLERRWDDVPLPEGSWGAPAPDHPFADDLDLTGHGSVLHLTGETATAAGRARLLRWLADPAVPEEGERRQEAVWELAGRLELRDRLVTGGRRARGPDPDALERFLAWAEGDAWLGERPALRAAALVLPVATAALAALQLGGVLSAPWWLASIGAALAVGYAGRRSIHARFRAVSDGEAGPGRLAPLIDLLARAEFQGRELLRRRAVLEGEEGSAADALDRLGRLSAMADARYAQLHVLLQALVVWDVNVLWALERWQVRHGRRVRAWLGALEEIDALAALARVVHMHPGWCRPDLRTGGEEDGCVLEACALGHPLLPPERCVRNDLRLGPPGSWLRVTGSNMAGKSTLLRAVGTDVVLARAGGPACATSLRLTPLRPWTSLQVRDSLEGGVSYFLAELQRLRRMLEAAGEPGTLLFLLDEPLRGTNPEERRIGSRRILRLLLRTGSVGIVATHDPAIADGEGLRSGRTDLHLGEAVEGVDPAGPHGGGTPAKLPGLAFDYRLRPGLAPRTNALRLMDALGLGEPTAPEGPRAGGEASCRRDEGGDG